jgi:hypothetical protein
MYISEKERSSCITRIISSRAIWSAVQTSRAVAVAKWSPPTLARDSSPMNSPEVSSATVASLPSRETTVSFALPVRS